MNLIHDPILNRLRQKDPITGADLSGVTTASIAESTNKKYITDAEEIAIGTIASKAPIANAMLTGTTGVDRVQFNTNPTVGAFSEGKMYYDTLWKTMAMDIDTDVTLQIGQETMAYCYNGTASPILAGTAVYIAGAFNGYPSIAPADNTSITTSFILGVVTSATVGVGEHGMVTIRGHVNQLNTNDWTAGTSLYLGTGGALTSTQPSAGSYDVRVGRVMIQDVSAGRIYVNIRPLGNLTDLGDVTIATPATDQVLRYNGTEWVNGSAVTSSASIGIEFFPDDTTIVASGSQSTYPIKTLTKVPVTTAEDVDSIVLNNNTVLYGTYVYDTALGRTSIDGGVWTFEIYAGVSSAAGASSLRQNINRARPLTGTLTTTGTGTTRTATASTGTPFATANIDVGGTIDSDSFIRTTTGYFRILSRVSDLEVTIETPSTYTNQVGVAASVHKRLFQITTPEINNTATSPLFAGLQLYSINSAQPAYTVEVNDKLATAFFGVSDGSRTVYFSHNGTARYTHFATPLITMHNNLAGLNGGTGSGVTGEYYHLTLAQYTAVQGLVEFTNTFTSSNSTGFAWTDNTLAITHNLGVQYVDVLIFDNNGVKVDYTVTATSTSVATVSFPINAIPITGTYNVRIR